MSVCYDVQLYFSSVIKDYYSSVEQQDCVAKYKDYSGVDDKDDDKCRVVNHGGTDELLAMVFYEL